MPFNASAPYSRTVDACGNSWYEQGGQAYSLSGQPISAPECDRAPARAKAIRAGSVALTSGQTSKAVAFAQAMPSAGYEVVLQPRSGLSVSLWPSALTANGFTINVSLGVNATVSYIAVEL